MCIPCTETALLRGSVDCEGGAPMDGRSNEGQVEAFLAFLLRQEVNLTDKGSSSLRASSLGLMKEHRCCGAT